MTYDDTAADGNGDDDDIWCGVLSASLMHERLVREYLTSLSKSRRLRRGPQQRMMSILLPRNGALCARTTMKNLSAMLP
eukprot:1483858-Amphidinium_carterae.1